METKTRKVISRSIFLVGVLCILLSSIFHISSIFYWFTGAIGLIYFLGGWYFFKGYYPTGQSILIFFLGYIYSGFFIGFAFASSETDILKAYFLWSIILIVLLGLAVFSKKENYKKGLRYFSLEAVVMLILSIVHTLLYKA